MKKIAFMFAAAALFAACGQKQAPAQEAEVEEPVEAMEEVIDSAAAWELVGDTTGMEADSIAAKFAAAVDTLKARAAAAAEEVVEGAEEAAEAATAE
ncbi:MAG: hypothetical protein IKQ05_03785 [Prevotella sp.]|jgi:ElaB/YqjD/DUF883 family membrane-anchored ribosome-binding protein|nr:hypothetical protein [Prevotella sp.]